VAGPVHLGQSARDVELDASLRDAVRELILCLADSKRLLGMRYAEWILGAPELEAGIACASMAQDEWGHARLLYALLKDFGADVERIEHGREPGEYCNLAALDAAPESWPELTALNALADTALTIQLEALSASSYLPLRQRVQKLVAEEQFHCAHGAAWLRRLAAGGPAARAAGTATVRSLMPALLQWFGPESQRATALSRAGVVGALPGDLRDRLLRRVAPWLTDLADPEQLARIAISYDDFDETSRRPRGTSPDAATIARIRGDKNRAFLMD
jgi:ring-1,2-phenylacetyl-CoA epoxidase subunit PaaC